jgi:hypothetical protein
MLTQRLDAIQQARTLQGHAHRGHAVAFSNLEDLSGDGRMDVEMMVGIDVVERQTGCPKGRELRLDFRRKLRSHLGAQDDVKPEPEHIRAQLAPCIDKVRYSLPRQHRPAIDEHEVQADAKRRQTARTFDGVVDRRTAYHQACRRQDSARMRKLDRCVDLWRDAEIIGRDDQRLQCAFSLRSRRN